MKEIARHIFDHALRKAGISQAFARHVSCEREVLRIFDQIFILTEGGPGFATETVSLYIYRAAFRFFDFGYAAAMSFVLLIITNLISAGYIRLLQRQEAM